ncbi:type IX secretion system membrane protein PorP/SprF [Robertkochia marina]|uniref:Type IX secretion system membrane protein PorP/SprF n=1 Tax=Robertkochia marina TaxID=1227945 RepID=A0A4S3M493_9FLAO|nr:type IX secretion system membrane protein PorP/SprF [Robertkochia marina]THD70014.1 type IX secretion system membrane protein PorP/SprF [Robertkochia marina]TRZ47662.1 type IX secretion system membrane protein PorP/SprF [Robertkochia marina]
MKKLIYAAIALLGITASAQELTLPTFTQYTSDNEFVISPTYAGIGDFVKVRGNALTQWVGIRDAPDTQTLVGDVRLGQRSGTGVLFYNDRNGFTSQMGARLSFAHHLTLNNMDDKFLSFGLSYNVNQFRIDINQFDPNADPSITDDRATTNHNFDVGILYRHGSFFASLNAANILNKDLNVFAISEPNRLRNYYLYTGYRYKEKITSSWEYEPSVFFQLFESDGRSSTDVNFKVRYWKFQDERDEEYYWFGLTYRFLNDQFLNPWNIGPMGGLKKGGFYVGYSYQVIFNEIQLYSTGTHVLTVGVDLFQGVSNCKCTMR